MVLIRAVSFKGGPVGREVAARFGEGGGTIGRGENSTLVLPDPERYISRTHASISFQAGGFVVTDNSSKNPIILNGQPLGPGSQARLRDGDEIQLGGYILEVTLVSSSDPHTSLGEARRTHTSRPPKDDPFAALSPSPGLPDPFAAPSKGASPSVPRHEAVLPPTPQHLPRDALADLHGKEPSIDDVLGLKSSGSRERVEQAPQPGRPYLPPEAADILDPLEFLGRGFRPPLPPTMQDHAQEIFTPFAPPAARQDPAIEIRTDVIPPMTHQDEPAAREVSPTQPARSSVPDATGNVLWEAFLRGAGVSDPHLPRTLTPDTLEAVGKLLREAVQGTLDLLRARGLMKSEMRADVTKITPMDNNPLKFSPTVEAALIHLLAPHVQGYTEPVHAMTSAYHDLRAHHLGFLAGMRAALEEVLARFAPEDLAKRLSDPTVLDSMLPMNRKAKQWDLFLERYEALAGEAREDFNTAFGRAFRRAYEAQVKELRREERRG